MPIMEACQKDPVYRRVIVGEKAISVTPKLSSHL